MFHAQLLLLTRSRWRHSQLQRSWRPKLIVQAPTCGTRNGSFVTAVKADAAKTLLTAIEGREKQAEDEGEQRKTKGASMRRNCWAGAGAEGYQESEDNGHCRFLGCPSSSSICLSTAGCTQSGLAFILGRKAMKHRPFFYQTNF